MKLYCIVYCILCSLLCTPMHNVHSLLKGTPTLPEVLHEFMPRSNCSAPTPPRAPPGTSLYCCCPGVLITLILTCPALCNNQNYPFFECPALFYHMHFFSDPGGEGGWGQNNLNGALLLRKRFNRHSLLRNLG